jgi:hypothetical protein
MTLEEMSDPAGDDHNDDWEPKIPSIFEQQCTIDATDIQ